MCKVLSDTYQNFKDKTFWMKLLRFKIVSILEQKTKGLIEKKYPNTQSKGLYGIPSIFFTSSSSPSKEEYMSAESTIQFHKASKQQLEVYTQDTIQSRIMTIRGHQVIMDADLAEFYQVKTIALNQAIKRNETSRTDGRSTTIIGIS